MAPGAFLFLVLIFMFKLSTNYAARCPDHVLIDFAKHTLGMQRCRADSMDALRVILGNQAHAEQIGGRLRLSRTAGFASEQTVRTLIDRFVDAGLARKERLTCARGRTNDIAVFKGVPQDRGHYDHEYIRLQRAQEAEDWRRMVIFPGWDQACPVPSEDVPY